MKRATIAIAVSMYSVTSFSSNCNEVNGTYQTVSESHSLLEIVINGNKALMNESAYTYDSNNEKIVKAEKTEATCSFENNTVTLISNEETITLAYSTALSQSVIGRDVNAAGFTLISENKSQPIYLWEQASLK